MVHQSVGEFGLWLALLTGESTIFTAGEIQYLLWTPSEMAWYNIQYSAILMKML